MPGNNSQNMLCFSTIYNSSLRFEYWLNEEYYVIYDNPRNLHVKLQQPMSIHARAKARTEI